MPGWEQLEWDFTSGDSSFPEARCWSRCVPWDLEVSSEPDDSTPDQSLARDDECSQATKGDFEHLVQLQDAETQSAATRFFHNLDLCILLCETLIANDRANSSFPIGDCLSHANTASLLAFRGVTREAWEAVMLEHRTRSALGLVPHTEAAQGILMYIDPLNFNWRPDWYPHPEDFNENLLTSMVTRNESDIAAFLTVEAGKPSDASGDERRPVARIITHHLVAAHIHTWPHLLLSSFWILAEQYYMCARLPLARDMFLTQPPQKAIKFGIRYRHFPRVQDWFWVVKEDGVRFRDLVEACEKEPEILYQTIAPGSWRHNSLFKNGATLKMDRIVWDFEKSIVKGHEYEKHAREMMRQRETAHDSKDLV